MREKENMLRLQCPHLHERFIAAVLVRCSLKKNQKKRHHGGEHHQLLHQRPMWLLRHTPGFVYYTATRSPAIANAATRTNALLLSLPLHLVSSSFQLSVFVLSNRLFPTFCCQTTRALWMGADDQFALLTSE